MSATLIWTLAIGLGVSILGGIAATIVVVKLPRDYFARPKQESRSRNTGQKIGKIAKNVAGVLLIVGGIVLLLPGVPGPGVVVLLLGLALTDIPGKQKLIQKVVRKPTVLNSMNRVRRRFGRPDLVTP
jgi:UPF0716 family protein affecting phage T7 exclusion